MPAALNHDAVLAAAVGSGDLQAVRDLLQQSAQLDGSVLLLDFDTPLLQAARLGHQDICALLLAGGATTTAVDAAGCSPLHTAAFRGHVGMCQLLLEAGADPEWVDNQGQTALHKAAFKGHVDVCRLLLTWGCYVDTRDCSGDTALQLCAFMQHSGSCMLLLDAGAGSQAGELRAQEQEFVRELVGGRGVPEVAPRPAFLAPPDMPPAPPPAHVSSSWQAAGPQAGMATASAWQGGDMRSSSGAEVQAGGMRAGRGQGPSTPPNTASSGQGSGTPAASPGSEWSPHVPAQSVTSVPAALPPLSPSNPSPPPPGLQRSPTSAPGRVQQQQQQQAGPGLRSSSAPQRAVARARACPAASEHEWHLQPLQYRGLGLLRDLDSGLVYTDVEQSTYPQVRG